MQVCTACTVVSLSTTSLNFNTPPLTWTAPFDARLLSKLRENPAKLLYKHSLVLKKTTSICSPSSCHRRAFVGSESYRPPKLGVSHCSNFRVAFCHCVAPCSGFAPCNCCCCHDPFIVRNAQTCPPFVFSQLVHPSRRSRSSLTTVLFLFSCFP